VERERLTECLARGDAPVPAWTYRRIDVTEVEYDG